MLTELLNTDTIQIADKVDTWQDAICLASAPLLQQNKIENRYIQAMIQSIEKYGPYVVLTPKVATPHSRPTDGVKALSMSLLHLQNPVLFAPDKPVYLIFILATTDSESHLQALVDLAQVIHDPSQIDVIIACKHTDEILNKIKQFSIEERL